MARDLSVGEGTYLVPRLGGHARWSRIKHFLISCACVQNFCFVLLGPKRNPSSRMSPVLPCPTDGAVHFGGSENSAKKWKLCWFPIVDKARGPRRQAFRAQSAITMGMCMCVCVHSTAMRGGASGSGSSCRSGPMVER